MPEFTACENAALKWMESTMTFSNMKSITLDDVMLAMRIRKELSDKYPEVKEALAKIYEEKGLNWGSSLFMDH